LEFSSPELRGQLEARTNVAVSIQAERISAPGTTSENSQGEVVLTRTAGAATGEYQVRVDNRTYSGTWTAAELTGVGRFDRVTRRMTVSLQTTAPTAPSGAWTADTTFIPGPGASSLEFPAIDLAPAGAAEAALRLGAVALVWDPVRREFAGEVGMLPGGEPSPSFCGLQVDGPSGAVWCWGKPMELPGREAAMLRALLARPGQAVAKERLLELVFTGEACVQPEAVEVVAYRLRKKLQGTEVCLVTLRGLGYLLRPAP
jgi:hypothetical protein